MARRRLWETYGGEAPCDFWKELGTPAILNRANNCYSYSVASLEALADVDSRAHAEATPQPGDASGIPKHILLLLYYRSFDFWIRLAERDGLTRLKIGPKDPLPELPAGQRLVAITWNPKYADYHWLRQERDGHWSHKPDSGRPPLRYDSQRQIITDPRKADLYYDFPEFVFMSLPERGIDVRMSKPWLKFFNSLDVATLGNYKALRKRLHTLALLVDPAYPVMADYVRDMAQHGDEQELADFWQHLQKGKRLPQADGLLPVKQAHAPLALAWACLAQKTRKNL